MKFRFVIISFILFICECQNRLDYPDSSISKRVIDYPNLLTPIQRDSLFRIIEEIRTTIGPHIAVLIIDSLNNTPVEEFASNTFEEIRLGRVAYKDGLLIVISMQEKLVRIKTGEGMIAIIEDSKAKLIIDTILLPKFREQNYFEGLLEALQCIKGQLEINKEYFNRLNKE